MRDKEGAAGRKETFLIDANKGFMKDGNKNRLRSQDIHKIVDTMGRSRPIAGARLPAWAAIQNAGPPRNLPDGR